MTYSLTKKLKSAGFTLIKDVAQTTREPMTVGGEKVYLPTLSELIEACGDRFSSLTRSPRNTWYVSWVEKGGSVELVRDIEESTPEEAVANLWLKLNEK